MANCITAFTGLQVQADLVIIARLMICSYITHSENETAELGGQLAISAKAGPIYTLDGDLGAGKTVLAKGFAKGLGVEETVTSPTFTLIREYQSGRLPLYHFDVYRIEDPEEMLIAGCEEYFYGAGVCLIEWADMISELLPEGVINIRLMKEHGSDNRTITIEAPDGFVMPRLNDSK